MGNSLTVYRRHSRGVDGISSCIKGYGQEDRVFGVTKYADGLHVHEPQKGKEKSQDCECPIVADGSLQNEAGRIRYRTLKTTQ
jgi:hypothetical protein